MLDSPPLAWLLKSSESEQPWVRRKTSQATGFLPSSKQQNSCRPGRLWNLLRKKPAMERVGFASIAPNSPECSHPDTPETRLKSRPQAWPRIGFFLKGLIFIIPFGLFQSQRLSSLLKKFFFVWAPVNFLSTPPPNRNSFLYSSKQSFFGTVGEESLKPLTFRCLFLLCLLLVSLALFRESLRGLPQH